MADWGFWKYWARCFQWIIFLYVLLKTNVNALGHFVFKALPPGRQFKVYISEDQLKKIRQWVRDKSDIETGGDLFGLWSDKHSVVVQFVLGPGKQCRRTITSFHQDIQYLEDVGKLITKNHGLCNIGQWHSHHRLDLPRPSAGDENTVWGNMPSLGIDRFVVFIAAIRGEREDVEVDINCFLFEIDNESKEQLPVLQGVIHEMKSGVSSTMVNNDKNLESVLSAGGEESVQDGLTDVVVV